MTRSLPILKSARIAAPCDVGWENMAGDDRVRYCGRCEKHVYNLIGMGNDEIAALIQEKEGKLCVHLYRRTDGTLLTSDCPVGLRAARRRLARTVLAVGACFAFLATVSAVRGVDRNGDRRLRWMEPFRRVAAWLAPPPLAQRSDGEMCVP